MLQAVVIIKFRDQKKIIKKKLPFFVGSSGLCDVIIPTLEFFPNLLVCNKGDILNIIDQNTGINLDPHALRSFGLEISAPFLSHSAVNVTFKDRWQLLLIKERFVFTKMPGFIKKIFGSTSTSKSRFFVFANFVLLALMCLSFVTHLPEKPREAVLLTENILSPAVIASSVNIKGYEKGGVLLFRTDPVKDSLLLKLSAIGLDQYKEITIDVNDTVVFESETGDKCNRKRCDLEILIPASLLKPENKITVTHQPESSPYQLKGFMLTKLQIPTSLEVEEIDKILQYLEKSLDELAVSPENFVTAHNRVEELKRLSNTRLLSDVIKTKIHQIAAQLSEKKQQYLAEQYSEFKVKLNFSLHKDAMEIVENMERCLDGTDDEMRLELAAKKRHLAALIKNGGFND